jgi:hypothetical protein
MGIYPQVIITDGIFLRWLKPSPGSQEKRREQKTPLFCCSVSACVRNKNTWGACFYFWCDTNLFFHLKIASIFCMARA